MSMLRQTPLIAKRPTPRRQGAPANRIKPGRVKDREHMARVAMLPCCVYGHWPVEVHHIRATGSMGRKAGDDETIPLCAWHHRTGPQAFHAGPRVFQAIFGTELDLLDQTRERLNRSGAT